MKLISIIVPTYNSQQTLEQCLNSVIDQSYSNIEIIVIDGQSTDTTIEIVEKKSNYNKNIVWLSEPDNGIYDAMNKGIKLAKGEWLYFLGSDDFLYDSSVLEDISVALSTTKSDLIYGNAIVTSNGGRHGKEITIETLLTSHNLCHQSIFYRKEIFSRVGNYNINYPIIADWDLNIRCFSNPDIGTTYIDRDVVLFNDVSGVSSISRDDIFYNLIPATYIKELDIVKRNLLDIHHSREYIMGKYIYDFLKKIGIIKMLQRFKK